MASEPAQHTETPYSYEFMPGVGGPDGRYVIKSETAERIAIFSTNGLGPGEDAEANAAFFLRACNSHDGLLGIVERFVLATKEEDVDALSRVYFEAMLVVVEAEGREQP